MDKDSKESFFKESFLLVNVKSDIVFGIFFLIINNANIDFQAQNLQLRSYTTKNVLLTLKKVKLIRKKEFPTIILNLEHEVFVIYIATLGIDSTNKMHPLKKIQIAHLKQIKLPQKFLGKIQIL